MDDDKIVCWEILRENPIHAIVSARTNGDEGEDARQLSDAIAAFEAAHSDKNFSYFPHATMPRKMMEGIFQVTCAVFAKEV